MIMLEIEKGETPENIIQIKNLIIKGELDKALQLLKICRENLDYGDQEKVLYQLLECDVLYQRGLSENLYTLAEYIYKERLKLGDKLIAVDMLNLMADCLLGISKEDRVLEKAFDFIKQSDRILKIVTQKTSKGILQREAYLKYVKGIFYFTKNDYETALKYFEQSAALGENFSNKLITILSLLHISYIYAIYKGELEQASIYGEKGLILAKINDHKFAIAYSYIIMAVINLFKGKINKCIFFNNRSLTIFKKLNSKYYMAAVLNNLGEAYRTKGNLKLALESIEKCLVLNHDLGLVWSYANNHDHLIQILVDIGDFQKAMRYLHQFKVLNNQLKDEIFSLLYLFDKALILKGSTTHAKQMQAKEIYRHLIRNNKIPFELLIKCLLNLCELLLDELHDTNNVELLNEIPLYINQIEDVAKKLKSYFLLAETYLLKANFDSFILNFERAKSNLTKAQNVAKRCGITSLVQRVIIQRKNIFHQTKEWQKLSDFNNVIMDFSNFTPLREQIKYMIKKRNFIRFTFKKGSSN